MKIITEIFNKKSKNNNLILYCDLDVVLTDFESSAKSIQSNIFELSEKRLWELITNEGTEFWSNMKWTNDGKVLWDYIKKYNPYILTALPGLTKNDPVRSFARKGKYKWVERELGKKAKKRTIMTVTKDKYKFSSVISVLIDDKQKVIDEWKKQGGIGIVHTSAQQTIDQLKK